MTANKVVISLSGGLDSTCLLLKLLSEDKEVHAYSFKYGQKHEIELTKVKKNIKFLQNKGFKVTHQIIDLTDVFSDSASSLHQGGEAIPHGDYREESMKSTVVENRNVIFGSIIYGKALSWANKTNSNVLITLGLHAGDHSIYPDCRPESQQAAEYLFKISNWGSEKVDYIAPFINIDKMHVLQEGVNAMKNLNFTQEEIMEVLKNTHTCYDPDSEGRSCSKCGSCCEREESFAYVGFMDPIEYQDPEYAKKKYEEFYKKYHK